MLPRTDIPCSNLILPISKKEVRVRAIVTKEEKNLLIQKEAGDREDIEAAIKDMVIACTFGKLDIMDMQIPDIVAIFLKIIEMSKGSTVTHEYICHHVLDNGEECLNTVVTEINLNEVTYTETKFKSDLVDLSETLKIKMKRPTSNLINEALKKAANRQEYPFRLAAECMTTIIDGDDVYNEFSANEAFDWIMELPITMSEILLDFINDVPSVTLRHTLHCEKCGNTQEVVLTGLSDFFPKGFLAII